MTHFRVNDADGFVTTDPIIKLPDPAPLLELTNVRTGKEILRFEENGDIYLHGELIEQASDVVDGFRQWLTAANIVTDVEKPGD